MVSVALDDGRELDPSAGIAPDLMKSPGLDRVLEHGRPALD
jgi:hypothetical protein